MIKIILKLNFDPLGSQLKHDLLYINEILKHKKSLITALKVGPSSWPPCQIFPGYISNKLIYGDFKGTIDH